MTPRELLLLLHDELLEEYPNPQLGWNDIPLTVPQLLHIMRGFDRSLIDAIGDENTPCPHNGNGNWRSIYDEVERCGQCGRKMEAVNEQVTGSEAG